MQTASNGIKGRLGEPWATLARAARTVVVGLLALAVVATATWALWLAWLSASTRVAAPGPASTTELLTLGAASAAIAIVAWLCLGAALEALSHLPGRLGATAGRWADRLTPVLARRVAAFALGVGVGVAGGPSQAVGASPDLGSSEIGSTAPVPGFRPTWVQVGDAAPDPGFQPGAARVDRPVPDPIPHPGFQPSPAPGDQPAAAGEVAPAPPTPGFTPTAPLVRKQADPTLLGARPSGAARPGTDRADTDEVVVHRGDTLWSIAAAHLDPDAEDAEVARAWPLWFEVNRDVIGDDPDVLLPGQVLRVPDPAASAAR